MSMSTNPDLSTESGIKEYLEKTPFACKDAKELSGGNANFIFRLVLVTPYKGQDTVILKHAKPFVKAMRDLAFGVDRQIYEVAALRQVRSWIPEGSLVTVPEIYFFDDKEHTIIMEDAGERSSTLKAFMQQGRATPAVAEGIGAELAAFLANFHTKGRGNKEACDLVKENQQSKEISAWYFFGRITETLRGADDVPMLSNPLLDIGEDKFRILEKKQSETRNAMLTAQESFVQGDFWPGNIMLALDETDGVKRIYVLDWEAAKAGLPGIDVGQFSAEIHLLRRFCSDKCGETAKLLFITFLREYKRLGHPGDEDMEYARRQLGAHLIVLPARLPWGGKELTREVVREGVDIMVEGTTLLDPAESA